VNKSYAILSIDDDPIILKVLEDLVTYARKQGARGVPLRAIVRHVLGLYHGDPGARAFRRMLSDASLLRDADHSLIWRARETMRT
jgi:tRNA-dihydrouridine synthase A